LRKVKIELCKRFKRGNNKGREGEKEEKGGRRRRRGGEEEEGERERGGEKELWRL
jgi:hypothetical protein